MITNLIYFLYNIKIEYIRKSKDGYIFFYNNNFYIFKECFIDDDYINSITPYINNSTFHEVVKNRKGKYISQYNENMFILMRVKINSNRVLLFDDMFSNLFVTYSNKKMFNWVYLWKHKIDQVEYIINSNENKFSISNLAIINYYIGLSEIAISIIDNNVEDVAIIPLSICHKRIRNDFDLYSYYDVTDLNIDHYARNLGEYVKSDIVNNTFEINKYHLLNKLSKLDRVLFLARVIFPSYFYDVFDEFILNNRDFKDFDRYFIEINKYEANIKELVAFMAK